jgi:glutamate:GABA antiporter
MSTTSHSAVQDTETLLEIQEKRKLQKHFGRWELLTYLVCTLVGLDTIGAVAKNGAQGFTWLAFLGLFFFLPYGLLVAEMGSTFTDEGGPYVWPRLAFGPRVAALNTILYWISNPIWLGGTLTITAITAFSTFLVPLGGVGKVVFGLAFIWFTVWMSILSFRVGKWLAIVGAWSRLIVLPLFVVSVVLYAFRHGLHGFHAADFAPTYAAFIAAVPVLVFNYVGFELPNSAGEEMQNPQRDVPAAVAGSAVATLLLYGVPSLAILLVLPRGHVTGLGGFLDAIKAVFTVYGGSVAADGKATLTGLGSLLGDVAAGAFIAALVSSGGTWLMGADRALAVSAMEGAAPPALGHFSSRYGTPVPVNLLSGVISTLLMALAISLSHGDANRYFQAVLGLAISTTTVAYLTIFPTLIKLRYTRPDVPRPYRIPGGMAGAWICGGLTTFWALLATVGLLWPGFGVGWFGTHGNPDASLPEGFAGQRLAYEVTQIAPLLLFLGLGLLFYALGRPTREQAHSVSPPKR